MNKKLLYITTAGLITSAFPVNTDAQTFYQCIPTNTTNEENVWDPVPILSVSPGACSETLIKPGIYLIYLRGGKGGDGYNYQTHSALYGTRGGYVAYKFKVDGNQKISITLCAGENGIDGNYREGSLTIFPVGSSGAGSIMKINEKLIIAGGGASNGIMYYTDDNKTIFYGCGGGALSNGTTIDRANEYKKGLSSYSSALDKNIYNGYIKITRPTCGKKDSKQTISISSGEQISYNKIKESDYLYPGYIKTNNLAGSCGADYTCTDGTATHQSNVSLRLACQNPDIGCAALYRLED